jgi:hypothetical protein
MSRDKTIELFNSKPRMSRAAKGEKLNGPNCLRSHHWGPGDVCVQIRMESSFVSAILSVAQARTFAQNIIDACDADRD